MAANADDPNAEPEDLCMLRYLRLVLQLRLSYATAVYASKKMVMMGMMMADAISGSMMMVTAVKTAMRMTMVASTLTGVMIKTMIAIILMLKIVLAFWW